MNKKTLLFWIFEIPILYILLRIYAYFVSPFVSALFGTTAFDIIIVLIVIVPLSLILSKLTSDFFLS